MSPAELWSLLAATNPTGAAAFLACAGPDAPHSLETLLALLESMPLSLREAALVNLVLSCVKTTIDAALPSLSLLQ